MLKTAAERCCCLAALQMLPRATATLQPLQHAQQQAWAASMTRTLFSSAEGGQGGGAAQQQPRSMLDAAMPHQGAAAEVLGSAAAARMQAAAAPAQAQRSFARRLLRNLFDVAMLGSLAATVAGGWVYYKYSLQEVQQQLEEAKQQLEKEPSLANQAWVKATEAYLRVAEPVHQKVREYADPSCDTLLPELAPELRGRVKTLVLDLEGVLVHKEWSRAKGWQVLKRPGAEAFLLEMGRRYEVVIYTDEAAMYADPVINKIDPHRAVPYKLYKQDTQYHNGKHVRDLSKLNRDLSQVLFISADPHAYSFQPENTLKLRAWDHSSFDTTLLDLIPFLQMVQEVAVDDVRDVVRSYDGEEDVAAAFKRRMAQLAQQKKGSSGGRFRRGS
eukprot:GHRQ01006068.1.p1 GENE.GHRQ01006068.1~~GHRQ01006068.1.p1  ORF type:complete len:386 (+),score=200.55 GHRQ01006068.1:271-1428(+)